MHYRIPLKFRFLFRSWLFLNLLFCCFCFTASSPKSAGGTPDTQNAQHSVQAILEPFHIQPNADNSRIYIPLELAPEDWKIYALLQSTVAQLIPEESHRPTVDLTITHPESNSASEPMTIGILGGMGPLTDSDLLGNVIDRLLARKINWEKLAIHVLSAPPPRGIFEAIYHPRYFLRLANFAAKQYHRYYLASNTAHLNIDKFRLLLNPRASFSSEPPSNTVIDLVAEVAKFAKAATQIQSGESNEGQATPGIFIVGTLHAFHGKLYPKYLQNLGFQSENIYELTTEARAEELQQLIDLAKSGKAADAGKPMEALLETEIEAIQERGAQIRTVILGCTEIPFALRGRLQKKLQRAILRHHGDTIRFINTEQVFADKIVSDIILTDQPQ